ncbi:MAG: MotA/TolQ/ExbB proton channel family protein [Gammaproteobacteria bacterium]
MEAFQAAVTFFQSGGLVMYPIALILAVGIAIAIERYIYLSMVRASNRRVWKRILPLLEVGKFDQALETAIRSRAAISNILGYGLNRARSRRSSSGEDIQLAMEEGLLEIVPRLEKRTHYLATFANIATLLGLLGTIMGLIEAFTAVSGAEPAAKADLLSASISVAMNTTAFGLMVAIPLLLAHAVMQTKTSEVVDSLEMATVRLTNLITAGSSAPVADAA